MEGWRPVIEYNPTLLGRFPKTVTNLVFYHELGHIHLGHIMSLKIYPERAEEFEFEADIFAATLYKRLEKTDDGLEDFFKFMDGQTKTKPSGPERAKIFRSILFAR